MLVNNNKNMHVKLDVSFPSGAKVELSKTELGKVTQFIHDMLFSEPAKEKKTYAKRKKSKSYQAWSDAEMNRLKLIHSMSTSAERVKAMRLLALESGRPYSAVYSQMYRLKTEKKAPVPVFFH